MGGFLGRGDEVISKGHGGTFGYNENSQYLNWAGSYTRV